MPRVLQNIKVPKVKRTFKSLQKEALKNIQLSENLLIDLLDASKFDLAKQLVDSSPELLNKPEEKGLDMFPLHSVCNDDNLKMFAYLHEKGANINSKFSGMSPTFLHAAIDGGHQHLVKYLLENCDPGLLYHRDLTLYHTPLDRAEMHATSAVNKAFDEILRILKIYCNETDYDDDDINNLLNIDLDSEKECRLLLQLLLKHDTKANCHLKKTLDTMTFSEYKQCVSIVRDSLNYFCC